MKKMYNVSSMYTQTIFQRQTPGGKKGKEKKLTCLFYAPMWKRALINLFFHLHSRKFERLT